ncbi:MAG: hypothetical protein JSU03_00745 [Bacteroidetes bacterium]|nr:hypothetical protein [Bacteroidota bacterium]MBS1755779.1 hypothetical protein [Bacteroidota bacterium]
MKYFLPALLFFCSPILVHSQDITGMWKGSIYNDSTHQTLQYEVFISKEKGKYSGLSHTWFLINNVKYYGIKKIKVHIAKDGKIIMQDAELIENDYPPNESREVTQLNVLDFINQGSNITLEGPFVTSHTRAYSTLTGHINLTRVEPSLNTDLGKYLQKNGLDKTLVVNK